jgi:hypothetical protein
MLGTKVKALKLFLKIKCYIAEKSRAVAMVTTLAKNTYIFSSSTKKFHYKV